MKIVQWNDGISRAEGYKTNEASSSDVYDSTDTTHCVFIIVQELNAEKNVHEMMGW